MPKLIVLCVDRDDDIGTKAGVKSPVIGRENNINAAIELGLKDPEDSDVNAILAAVSLYDELRKEGKDVEVVTISGHPSVGIKSDEIISSQLNIILEKFQPEEVILVSDGAEDEYIMPIVTSRLKVRTLRRVLVKQSKNIESTYYMIIKLLSEPKIVRKILIPIALILLSYAFATLIVLGIAISLRGVQGIEAGTVGTSMITLTLGLYFLEKGLQIKKKFLEAYSRLRKSVAEAKITIISDLIAITIIVYGFSEGYRLSEGGVDPLQKILLFFNGFVLWFMLGMIVREGGRTLDVYLHGGKFKRSFWIAIFTVIATGMVFLAFVNSLQWILGYHTLTVISTIVMIIAGVIIGIVAALLQKIISEGDQNEV